MLRCEGEARCILTNVASWQDVGEAEIIDAGLTRHDNWDSRVEVGSGRGYLLIACRYSVLSF